MSSEWPKVKLSDYCDKIGSGATPRGGSKVYLDEGEILLVRSQNVYNHGFEYDGLVYIDEKAAEKLSNVELKENDVLINITGDSVARVCMVPDDVLPARVNQHVSILRPKENALDPRFLRYSLVNYENQYKLLAIASAGGTRKAITKGHLEEFEIDLPDLAYQKEVCEILSTFDQKIYINQQTNETLEAMAQAIFKSWFVDFDPVRAKIKAASAVRDPNRAAMAALAGVSLEQPTPAEASEGRDWDEIEAALDQKLSRMTGEQREQLSRTAELFPDELVESEIGEVPKGWEVVELKKVIKNFDRKRVPLSRREREERPGKYPYYGATSIMDYVDDYLFEGRNVLMAEDGSVMDDDGKPVLQYVEGKIWVNNHAHVLNGKGPITNEVLYLFLQTVNISPYVTGAVQKKINQGNMNSIPFLLADEKLYKFISPTIKGLFDKIIQNENENEELENLRDTLLPKLISGEIQINN